MGKFHKLSLRKLSYQQRLPYKTIFSFPELLKAFLKTLLELPESFYKKAFSISRASNGYYH